MKYCQRCVMPDTRPGEWQKIPEVFDENGVCLACRNYDRRKEIDWNVRWNELERICDLYRSKTDYWDCVIPVSGGKDSTYIVWTMRERLRMNPLLVNISDPFTHTYAGDANIKNASDFFNCDVIQFRISEDLFRRTTRITFEEMGHPLVLVEAAIYAVPILIATNMGIHLLVQGENPNYEYGTESDDSPAKWAAHMNQIISTSGATFWESRGISSKELNFLKAPQESAFSTQAIFLSYFEPWDGYKHMQLAKTKGFRDLTHEWIRENAFENFDQIDSIGWIMALWLKYPKFGFSRATDIACRWIREGRITRNEAIELVNKYDPVLDQRVLDDFLDFTGYSVREFWDIVEKFWNRDIFEKVNGLWRKKDENKL